ncbi:MAG: hypothetical protein A4E53_01264 [Pelotomaculum sp. PtaB.Bin104]|nr:MAG: hypothetical protein A4E53_01264 [Pelotomaculum sp. PtaB.Bin104]
MTEIAKTFLYSLIVFVLLISLARIIGYKLLSQLTFFDFVVTITIGTIAATFITSELKGFYVLLSPVVLTMAVVLTGYLTVKSAPARKLIQGNPVIIIQNGKIMEDNMRKARYHLDQLLMQLRTKNVFDLSEVEFAILEPNGELSVLKKSQKLALTPEDLGINTNYKGLASEIIKDGKIIEDNLKQNRLTHEWLFNELASKKIDKMEDVLLASLSTNGSLYIDLKRD